MKQGAIVRAFLQKDEPEEIYRELVDGLADDIVPPLVLAVLLLASGVFIFSIVQDALVIIATALGVFAAFIRTGVILHYQRSRTVERAVPLSQVRRQEAVHGASIVALSVTFGLFSLSVYRLPSETLSLLTMCIGFGLSGGLIARVSIRPRIASIALVTLGMPGAITMSLFGTPTHLAAAAFILFFTVSALQSVAFIYETARRGVALRLQVEAQARRDALTGLLNRFGLQEAIAALPSESRRAVAIHAIDLDGFKTINDTFGHPAGDRLLSLLAERIRSVVPQGAISARIGGDEFVIVQLDVAGEAAARRLAEHLHLALSRSCDVGGNREVKVGLSLGYAVGSLPDVGFEHLHHLADAASYAAKRAGGGIRAHGEFAASPEAA